MSALIQAVDDKNQAIAILGFAPNSTQKLVANSSSANATTGFNATHRVFTIVCDQPVLFEYNSSSNVVPSVSNSAYLPAAWVFDVKVKDSVSGANTYFAFQAVNISANVFISPRT
jgi:hypothetical protein